MAINDYDALAKTIVELVGGEGNVSSYRHCATRLRFRLKDEGKAQTDNLKATDGVITVVSGGGEYMVVIGNEVEDVYNAVERQLGSASAEAALDENADASAGNRIMALMNIVMGSIQPALNMLCAGGIMKGLLSVLSMAGILAADSGLYTVLNAAGDAVFYFLPVVIGINFCKTMGVDSFLGLIIGATLCYPTITGQELTLFGITNTTTYSSSFLPALLVCACAVPLFKVLKKYLPNAISGFGAPFLTLLVVIPLGLAFIGPAATWAGARINDLIVALMTTAPLIAGLVFGGLYQTLILFGIHQAVTSFAFMNLLGGNPDPIMGIACLVCFAQIGTVAGIMLKTKSRSLKELALPTFISGFFGITEPLIYGVTLPRFKTFVISSVGGALIGAISMMMGVRMYAFTGLGVFSVIGYINPEAPNLAPTLIAIIAGFVFSLIAIYMLYQDEGADLANAQQGK